MIPGRIADWKMPPDRPAEMAPQNEPGPPLDNNPSGNLAAARLGCVTLVPV